MYADAYGTGWESISAEEAIERAYALGVAETLGETHEGELKRLVAAAGTVDDRALVRLAFDKGRSRGRSASAEADPPDRVWDDLVSEAEREPVTITSDRDLPPPLRGLPLLDRPGDHLERIRLPKFLTR